MPNSVGESGAFINPGNPGIIEGIFLLHHHTHHRHAPPRAAPVAPQGANRSRFHPARSGVRGVFWARGMARSPLPARVDARRASNPSPALPLSGEGATGRARRRAGRGRDAGRARFPPCQGGPGGSGARAHLLPCLAAPLGCLRPGIEGSCHPFLALSPLRQCPSVGHERYPATLPRVAVPLRCPKTGHKRVSRYPPLPRADPRMARAGASKGRAAPPLGVHDPSLGLGDPPEGRGGAPLGLGHPPMGVSDPPEGR